MEGHSTHLPGDERRRVAEEPHRRVRNIANVPHACEGHAALPESLSDAISPTNTTTRNEAQRTSPSLFVSFSCPAVLSMSPGAITFERTPCGPISTARHALTASTAALAADAWICHGVAL